MKRCIQILMITAAMLIVLPLGGQAARPSRVLQNIPQTAHGAEPESSLDQIVSSIERAARAMQWLVLQRKEGEIRLSLDVRGRHVAIVDVGYDETSYWINYRDSTNLNYRPGGDVRRVRRGRVDSREPRIHPNYNVWVKDLARQIEISVSRPIQSRPKPPAKRIGDVMISDELGKLSDLRDRGVLTDEEFENEKARLLNR